MQSKCDFESEIVISGLAGKFPKSENLDEFWQNLVNGTDMVSDEIDRYNVEEYDVPNRVATMKTVDKFDSDYFSMHAKQAAAMDPRIRILMETAYEAIVDAGVSPTAIRGSKTGVFVAVCDSEPGSIWKRSYTKPNMYGILGNVGSMAANRLSYHFDLHGPSYVLDTACSSSSVALQQALLSIRAGLCDAAIVGSAHTLHDPIGSWCFHALKMTADDGKCKVLDAAADGYVRAEAAAAIYICKKQVAKRSYGTLIHASTNSDGYKEEGITFPSEFHQEKAIRQVYDDCGISPLEVDYVEIHGTGTKVGDPEEMLAVSKVFCEGRKGPLLVGAVKSNMGHPEPVAGLCGIAKVVLSHHHGIIPANLHYYNPNPDIPSLHDGRIKVVDKNQPFTAKYVGFNSMGFGGTNVHILLRLDPKEKVQVWSPAAPLMLLTSGRTQEGVETFLEKALARRQDRSFVGLIHEISKHDILKHDFRGYVIVESDKMEIQVEPRDSGRQMWFVYTGLGSQWAGMSRDLIKFDIFKKSIQTSAQTLLNNHNFDIISLLECADSKKFEDFKNSVVSITTIQIALTELLKTIGIEPEGIVGHSTGEVAAGYADGCLTQHQAVLTSFARVRAVLESNLQPGIVASVGLTWEEAKKRCPPGVYPAIHNAKENVTIAGSPDDITAFIKILESEGVFAKLVRSASFGFHSPLVEESGKLAKVLLQDIIPEPKPRSSKWLSSSVPEARWGTDLAKYCSADYYVNNGVNPVYFYPTIKHVPDNVVVLEIAPHCFMQTILKQSLPKNAITTGLIHVKSPDNCKYFLDAIGKCYIAGVNVDIAGLYEPVQFPVSAATPNISSLIQWDHSVTYDVPHHKKELSRQKGVKYTCNLSTEQDAFLEGHSVDGKILFPATGYMWLVWKCFAQQQGSRFEKHPVVLENVRFERVTLLSKRTDTDFLVNIFSGSGKFEITESDMVVCTGTVRNVDESVSNEMLNYNNCQEVDASGPSMNKEDFYKEMHLRGYGHTGLFQGVEQSEMQGKWAKIKWQGEWVSFIDTVLQAFLLLNESRDLYVPMRVQKFTIDPVEAMNYLGANDNIMEVKSWENYRSGTCPGMEIRGATFAKFNQKSRQIPPATIEQAFTPYLRQPATLLSEAQALEVSLEIAVENSFGPKFLFTEILKSPQNMIAHAAFSMSMLKFQAFELRLVNESDEVVDEDKIAAAMSKVITLQDVQSREQNHVVFVDDQSKISLSVEVALPSGFVLYKGSSLPVDIASRADVSVVSEKVFVTKENTMLSYFLIRKLSTLPLSKQVISTDTEGFDWVESAKTAVQSPDAGRVYFVSQYPKSGIVGFVKCLAREVTSEKIRCFHGIDKLEINVNQPSADVLQQIQKDLLFNVYKQGSWGALSNMTISKEEFRQKKPSSFAYANALTLGELSSLSWIESPLKNETKELVDVHFSSLNFRDVMLASGKLVQDSLTEKTERPDCVMGLEFSGTYQGRRVCGMGISECLASRIDPKNKVLLDIPENWSFEEAATVPCVYVTVYLALILRGKMKPGESILIHAGSGGVGQAAIQVALSMKCRVFTTVSTEAKREFLKARFPGLTDESFANSRNAKDFESHIYEHTKGRGVDLILNSLAQDKLFASIRCLAINGRFLEIGKFDVFNDTNIGMSILAKGVSVFGILADQMVSHGSAEEIQLLLDYMNKGMSSGTIQPLTYHVFKHDQLEEAFRFMAQGKHMGKVIIQTKEAENAPAAIPAVPRTYFCREKSYIIIGGLGGMGFEIAIWMVQRGAKKLILSSRSGKTSTYHEYHIGGWERNQVTVVLDKSDVTTVDGASSLLKNAQKLGPIGGIFNVAVVLKDALFENQTKADFQDVVKCKADATIHLDTISRQLAPQLDHFVVFSSIIAARGNPGQTNYGFANSVMERICEQRKYEGLPALAVQWGAVGDVGVFHRTMKDKNVFGLAPQTLKSCIETLDTYLQHEKPVVSSFVPFQRKEVGAVDTSETLVSIAANILGIKDLKKTNPKTPLVDLGMDSLMAAELGQVLQTRANLQLSQKAYSQLTFEKLAEIESNGAPDAETNPENSEKSQVLTKMLSLKSVPRKVISEMKSLKKTNEKVFIVHPIDGTVAMLEEMVSQMDAHVYGIECVKDAPLESIQKLASFYLKKVKEFQPTGPYKIIGYSFGFIVAFEIALQLEKQNEAVSLLLSLDGSPRLKSLLENIADAEEAKREWEHKLLLGYLTQYSANVTPIQYKELLALGTVDDKVKYISELLEAENPDVSAEEICESLASFVARGRCGLEYEPSGKVKTRTVLVKALHTKVEEGTPSDYGLSDVCENAVEVIGIAGNHYCFYEKPAELGISAILNKILS